MLPLPVHKRFTAMFCLCMPFAAFPSPNGKNKTPGCGSKVIRRHRSIYLSFLFFRPIVRTSLRHTPRLGPAGLWFVPVAHEGNQNSSPEEVEAIVTLVQELTQSSVRWVDNKGQSRPLRLDDILIVAPYNAQVSDLAARLPNARIGTVDKFQGQEAPIAIYSLTSSSPEDAPRGMEFLYNPNRLNVATSRAKAMVIIVGSPHLLEPECHSPGQMLLANALCRYVELARTTGFAIDKSVLGTVGP